MELMSLVSIRVRTRATTGLEVGLRDLLEQPEVENVLTVLLWEAGATFVGSWMQATTTPGWCSTFRNPAFGLSNAVFTVVVAGARGERAWFPERLNRGGRFMRARQNLNVHIRRAGHGTVLHQLALTVVVRAGKHSFASGPEAREPEHATSGKTAGVEELILTLATD
ncbi:hypothetical protein Tco_0773557 [Tanacetum coccineum]|uniref:Uncharacterized protein n=1 Tax=Tanacetum coccineum TaxID=301880 RepID=A0ABQ4ZMF5_9ASTR